MATILKFPKPPHAKQETQNAETRAATGRPTGIEEGADLGTLSHPELAKACAVRQRVRDAIAALDPEKQAILTSAMYELGGDHDDLSGYVPLKPVTDPEQYRNDVLSRTDTPLTRLAADPNAAEFASALRALRFLK